MTTEAAWVSEKVSANEAKKQDKEGGDSKLKQEEEEQQQQEQETERLLQYNEFNDFLLDKLSLDYSMTNHLHRLEIRSHDALVRLLVPFIKNDQPEASTTASFYQIMTALDDISYCCTKEAKESLFTLKMYALYYCKYMHGKQDDIQHQTGDPPVAGMSCFNSSLFAIFRDQNSGGYRDSYLEDLKNAIDEDEFNEKLRKLGQRVNAYKTEGTSAPIHSAPDSPGQVLRENNDSKALAAVSPQDNIIKKSPHQGDNKMNHQRTPSQDDTAVARLARPSHSPQAAGTEQKRGISMIKLGAKIKKKFDKGLFEGTITELPRNNQSYYLVKYEDGDEEDLSEAEILELLDAHTAETKAKAEDRSAQQNDTKPAESSLTPMMIELTRLLVFSEIIRDGKADWDMINEIASDDLEAFLKLKQANPNFANVHISNFFDKKTRPAFKEFKSSIRGNDLVDVAELYEQKGFGKASDITEILAKHQPTPTYKGPKTPSRRVSKTPDMIEAEIKRLPEYIKELAQLMVFSQVMRKGKEDWALIASIGSDQVNTFLAERQKNPKFFELSINFFISKTIRSGFAAYKKNLKEDDIKHLAQAYEDAGHGQASDVTDALATTQVFHLLDSSKKRKTRKSETEGTDIVKKKGTIDGKKKPRASPSSDITIDDLPSYLKEIARLMIYCEKIKGTSSPDWDLISSLGSKEVQDFVTEKKKNPKFIGMSIVFFIGKQYRPAFRRLMELTRTSDLSDIQKMHASKSSEE